MKIIKKRNVLIVLLFAVLIVLAFASCKKKVEEKEAAPPEPEKFYYPLTGEEAESEDVTKRRAISVKIENSSDARPQSGLSKADFIFETMVEGGETRYNAIFQSEYPKELGDVRSARLSDATIVPWFNSVLIYSGSNSEVNAKLKSIGIDKMAEGKSAGLTKRVDFRVNPHNLYLYMTEAKIAKVLKRNGFSYENEKDISQYYGDLEEYEETLITEDVEVTETEDEVDVEEEETVPENESLNPQMIFSGIAKIEYKYSEKNGNYVKYINDNKQVDKYYDVPMTAENVIAYKAEYPTAEKLDPAGNPTYNMVVKSGTEVFIFRDGKVFEGTIEFTGDEMPKYIDKNGNQIPLKVGNTHVEIVEDWTGAEIKK